MKTNNKLNKGTKEVKQNTIINFQNTKHVVWNKRRRYGV
jgi:hypothetical protein